MVPPEGRYRMTPEPGTVVTVHMNLNNVKSGKPRWSIKHKGKVVCNVDHVTLRDCTPLVAPGGHRRILSKGHREVYARVKGTLVSTGRQETGQQEIHLNPHRCRDFTMADGTVYTGSPMAYFNQDSFFTV